jgi:hypothetical protein
MSRSLLCGLCLGVLSSSSVCASAAVGYRAELRAAIDRGDYPKTTSILVVRNGTLVYESYFGNGRRSLLNDTRSAMKAVTALAVGAAIADGAIPSADAPAFKFFADLRPW